MYLPFDKIFARKTVLFIVGLLIGFLLFAGLRMAFVQQYEVHYHANFGLFINGQRDKFKNFTFYEEVESCAAGAGSNPKSRAHMHDNINDVVHVEDDNVTWGAFFANLGYGLSDGSIETDDGVFVDGQRGRHLRFILNGEPVETIANRVINSEDVLLIDYGPKNTDLDFEYNQIGKTAREYDSRQDPAACSGEEPLDFAGRLKRAFDFRR